MARLNSGAPPLSPNRRSAVACENGLERIDGLTVGIGAEREHAAVARVERDEAAGGAGALVDRLVEVLLAGLLQAEVERGAHRAPGHRVVARSRALRAARGRRW